MRAKNKKPTGQLLWRWVSRGAEYEFGLHRQHFRARAHQTQTTQTALSVVSVCVAQNHRGQNIGNRPSIASCGASRAGTGTARTKTLRSKALRCFGPGRPPPRLAPAPEPQNGRTLRPPRKAVRGSHRVSRDETVTYRNHRTVAACNLELTIPSQQVQPWDIECAFRGADVHPEA